MPHIRILPVDVRNKIAAGEVIERPASVAKELIENSIDAGSTEISVEISYGGKRLISVSDNGSGMDREDALLAFKPHATSKLLHESDLFNIRTMGFRGEALSSIASVSRVRLTTGPGKSSPGVSVEIAGGEAGEVKEAASSGTVIEVRDLFYNTPARKKFLKTNATELYHIIDIVTRESLSHPEIHFRLITDKKETVNMPSASGIRERLMQVYGEEFLGGLTCAEASETGIEMHAFVSRGENFRNSRSHQFLFINRRPVKDPSVTHAVYKAFEGILPRERHPIFSIFLTLDPKTVDFNVHPTKREVRFEDKETLYRFVYSHIRDAVKQERTAHARPFLERTAPGMPSGGFDHGMRLSALSPDAHSGMTVSENLELTYSPLVPSLYIGDTFIAISGKGGLTLIDHHAAHERILYEQLLKGVNLNTHQLLFPLQVSLSHKEYAIILRNIQTLRDFGIEADDFGKNTIIVRALPDSLQKADVPGILSDIATWLLESTSPEQSLRAEFAARLACHASVRGTRILNQEEVSNLVADLEKTDQPDQCPHGRPTRLFFSLNDLNKMFKRK
jgi:DNA mismatch repair protein MutL